MDIEKYEEDSLEFLRNIPESMQYLNLYEYRTNRFQYLENDSYRTKFHKGVKKYDYSTIDVEGVKVFLEKITPYRKQYQDELTESIGKNEYNKFKAVLKDWVDGKSKRNSTNIRALKKDIFIALQKYLPTLEPSKLFSKEDVSTYYGKGLTYQTITTIIELNRKYLDMYMELTDEISDSEYMLFRGLNVDKELNLETDTYKEDNFLTSYSFSPSLAEQFSITGKKKSVIIKGDLKLFQDRIIATSLLHSPLKRTQLEILVCPHWTTMRLKYDGYFDGIEEYTLSYAPNYKGII